jgi:hypothetical protein
MVPDALYLGASRYALMWIVPLEMKYIPEYDALENGLLGWGGG